MRPIRKIVVIGANGTMGAGSGALFASAGIPTVFLARTLEKAEAGRLRADHLTKGKIPPNTITVGTYDSDLAHAAAEADFVFEAVAEDLAIKRQVFALIDRVKAPGAIVATVSSGLSIASMCEGRSEELQKHFLGVHLFNPPTLISGTEIIPHAGTDRAIVEQMRDTLETTFGRVVIECADAPAFAGNRIGFKVLNEIAQLAEEHGVAYMDQLVGSHTGRALAPLATIDLVGWDVHAAIVDNIYANTHDEAHAQFRLPAYMSRGIARGHLGRKTRDKGGFFRVDGKGAEAVHFALDPATGDYRPLAEVKPAVPAVVERMKAALLNGQYEVAFDVMCRSTGKDAILLRRVMLGYISYALGRVGEVVAAASDVDRIMGFGFNWAPPSVLVDAIGAPRTIELLERERLPIPSVLVHAAAIGIPMCQEKFDSGRFFAAA